MTTVITNKLCGNSNSNVTSSLLQGINFVDRVTWETTRFWAMMPYLNTSILLDSFGFVAATVELEICRFDKRLRMCAFENSKISHSLWFHSSWRVPKTGIVPFYYRPRRSSGRASWHRRELVFFFSDRPTGRIMFYGLFCDCGHFFSFSRGSVHLRGQKQPR